MHSTRLIPALALVAAVCASNGASAQPAPTDPGVPPPPPPLAPGIPPPPPPGAVMVLPTPTDEASYSMQVDDLKRQIKDAKRRDDDREVHRLEDQLKALKRAYKEYRDRTTMRYSTGLMVGGIVAGGLGIGSLFASLVIELATIGASSTQTHQLQTAALITAMSGVVLIGAGVPLTLVGARRVPRTEGDEARRPSPVPLVAIGPGSATMRWTF